METAMAKNLSLFMAKNYGFDEQVLCSGGLSVRIAGKDKGIVACYLQQLVFPAILNL
jgi:hypothetical protein